VNRIENADLNISGPSDSKHFRPHGKMALSMMLAVRRPARCKHSIVGEAANLSERHATSRTSAETATNWRLSVLSQCWSILRVQVSRSTDFTNNIIQMWVAFIGHWQRFEVRSKVQAIEGFEGFDGRSEDVRIQSLCSPR
jgi:hypothetical protein